MDPDRPYDIRIGPGASEFELVASVFETGDVVTFPNYDRFEKFIDYLSEQNLEYTAYAHPFPRNSADYTLSAEPSTHNTDS